MRDLASLTIASGLKTRPELQDMYNLFVAFEFKEE
jgi:hypothetical protein